MAIEAPSDAGTLSPASSRDFLAPVQGGQPGRSGAVFLLYLCQEPVDQCTDPRGSDAERHYSLPSDPNNREFYEICVLAEPGGRGGSLYLHEQIKELQLDL